MVPFQPLGKGRALYLPRGQVSDSTWTLLLPAEGPCGGCGTEVGGGRGGERTLESKGRWSLGSSFRRHGRWTRSGAWRWSQDPDLEGRAPLGSSPLLVHHPQLREVKLLASSPLPRRTQLSGDFFRVTRQWRRAWLHVGVRADPVKGRIPRRNSPGV